MVMSILKLFSGKKTLMASNYSLSFPISCLSPSSFLVPLMPVFRMIGLFIPIFNNIMVTTAALLNAILFMEWAC